MMVMVSRDDSEQALRISALTRCRVLSERVEREQSRPAAGGPGEKSMYGSSLRVGQTEVLQHAFRARAGVTAGLLGRDGDQWVFGTAAASFLNAREQNLEGRDQFGSADRLDIDLEAVHYPRDERHAAPQFSMSVQRTSCPASTAVSPHNASDWAARPDPLAPRVATPRRRLKRATGARSLASSSWE